MLSEIYLICVYFEATESINKICQLLIYLFDQCRIIGNLVLGIQINNHDIGKNHYIVPCGLGGTRIQPTFALVRVVRGD